MLGRLIIFELKKKWKFSKFVLLGYGAVQLLLLLIMRVFLWNEGVADGFMIDSETTPDVNVVFVLFTILFFGLSAMFGAYPFLESMYRFERDISGRQAYLELMIPAAAWQKVLSKLAATLVSLVVCGTASLFSIFMYLMVNSDFRYLTESIKMLFEVFRRDPLSFIAAIILILFGFACFYILIFLCIAVAKSFTHKNAVAVPIGILTFIIITILMSMLEAHITSFPLYTFRFAGIRFSLSTTIMNVILFGFLLMATGWLMEKKIEH